jgi:quercetin dioxygenase-like cupin family protein
MSTHSQHFSLGPDEGEAMLVLGDVVTFKITPAESDNAYFMVEITSVPGGGPQFLHTHIPQETFWILEGEYEVYGQDENGEKYAIEALPGATVHVPGNVPHGFRNVGDTMGKVLAIYAPVTHQPEFFTEIGVPMDSSLDPMPVDQMPGPDRTLEILAKHEMRLIENPFSD